MAKFKFNIITALATAALAVSLVLFSQARASLRQRDDQLQRLRERKPDLVRRVAEYFERRREDE